jgi:hypothetical protein
MPLKHRLMLPGSLAQVSSAYSNSYPTHLQILLTKSQGESYKANNDVPTRTPTDTIVDQLADPRCTRSPELAFGGVVLQ